MTWFHPNHDVPVLSHPITLAFNDIGKKREYGCIDFDECRNNAHAIDSMFPSCVDESYIPPVVLFVIQNNRIFPEFCPYRTLLPGDQRLYLMARVLFDEEYYTSGLGNEYETYDIIFDNDRIDQHNKYFHVNQLIFKTEEEIINRFNYLRDHMQANNPNKCYKFNIYDYHSNKSDVRKWGVYPLLTRINNEFNCVTGHPNPCDAKSKQCMVEHSINSIKQSAVSMTDSESESEISDEEEVEEESVASVDTVEFLTTRVSDLENDLIISRSQYDHQVNLNKALTKELISLQTGMIQDVANITSEYLNVDIS